MEEKKQVTPMEGLNIAVNQLNSINVPVGLTEQIAIPLARAINLIQQCIPLVQEKVPEESAIKEAKPEDVPEDAEIIDLGEIVEEGNGNDHAE